MRWLISITLLLLFPSSMHVRWNTSDNNKNFQEQTFTVWAIWEFVHTWCVNFARTCDAWRMPMKSKPFNELCRLLICKCTKLWYIRCGRFFLFSSITNKMQRYTIYLFISVKCSTCFRRFLHSSSGAQNCIYSMGYFVIPWLLPATVVEELELRVCNFASCWLHLEICSGKLTIILKVYR